uniref:3HCDH domain-containing protein n=1 Tax=Echinostoma caproni TaxID=27848 RepID=A0A183AEP7_9TREM
LDISKLRNSGMVIEAVFEDLKLKQQVLKDVEDVIPDSAVFASNTSALPIHQIAAASKRPEKVSQLFDLVPSLASATDVGLRQGKVVITVKDGPVSPTELNTATVAFGWPIGLATLADEVGIDVVYHVAEFLSTSFKTRMAVSGGDIKVLKEMVAAGMLGRKSGRGIFHYPQNKSSTYLENNEVLTLMERFSITPKAENTRERIQYRLFSRFVNEAVLCLQEGILVNGPVDGDVGAVFGLGFPPCLGGPFRYLDMHGSANMVSRMDEFRAIYGDQFEPCSLLMEHAKNPDKQFHKR